MADFKNKNQQGSMSSNQEQLQSALNEAEQALQGDPLKQAVEKKKKNK